MSEALFKACREGDLDQVQALIRSGAHVNQTDSGGATPLHYATQAGKLEVCKYLIRRGAKIYRRTDLMGHSSWHWACHEGHTDIVKMFLAHHKAHPESFVVDDPDKTGDTPLILAARNGKKEVVELLVNYGSRILPIGSDGRDAAQWAAKKLHTEILTFLISRGADVNLTPTVPLPKGKQAQHKSIAEMAEGKSEILEALRKGLAELKTNEELHPELIQKLSSDDQTPFLMRHKVAEDRRSHLAKKKTKTAAQARAGSFSEEKADRTSLQSGPHKALLAFSHRHTSAGTAAVATGSGASSPTASSSSTSSHSKSGNDKAHAHDKGKTKEEHLKVPAKANKRSQSHSGSQLRPSSVPRNPT